MWEKYYASQETKTPFAECDREYHKNVLKNHVEFWVLMFQVVCLFACFFPLAIQQVCSRECSVQSVTPVAIISLASAHRSQWRWISRELQESWDGSTIAKGSGIPLCIKEEMAWMRNKRSKKWLLQTFQDLCLWLLLWFGLVLLSFVWRYAILCLLLAALPSDFALAQCWLYLCHQLLRCLRDT